MTQTSQVVVSALNRIFYPEFVRRGQKGLAPLLPFVMRYALCCVLLACATAFGVYVIAAYLPMVLGEGYGAVTRYLQTLCWLIVPIALQTIPYDVLGAVDRHPNRAAVYNAVSLIGIAVTLLVVFREGINGALWVGYLVNGLLALALWIAFFLSAKASLPQGRGADDEE